MTAILILVAVAAAAVNAQAVTTQTGSIVSAVAGIPECASFSKFLSESKTNTYMAQIFPNLTFAAGDKNPPAYYTVLAYTDTASNALAAQNNAASALLTTPNNRAALMTYHIIPNKVIDFNTASSFSPFVPTALSRYGNGFDNLGFGQNQNIGVKVVNGVGVFTTGLVTGTVLKSIKTDYGIIHVIDTVMSIPTDIVSIYSSLLLTDYGSWMKATNLSAAIKPIQGVTVLIPAQGGIPRFLTANNNGNDVSLALKQSILQYQIIPGVFYSNQIASSKQGDLAKNTAQQTYFNGQVIYATDATTFAPTSTSNSKIVIQTPDILFDSGVIHIVDSVLLPPSVSNAQAAPVPSPLAQIYPPGLDPNAGPPLGNDVPVGAIVGGVAAGLVLIGVAWGLYVVIRRRRLIAQLEQEKYMRQMEMNEYYQQNGGAGDIESGAGGAVYQVPLKATAEEDEEEEEDDEEEEEEEEESENVKASYDQIMQYRRAQWAADDPKRKSVSSSNKRSSVAIDTKRNSKRLSGNVSDELSSAASNASAGPTRTDSRANLINGSSDKRNSTASFNYSKRMSTASNNGWDVPPVVINDVKEAKKEAVRNSWWSATGVGGNTHDAAVLEAQAIREEQRKSWWSGSGEVQEVLHDLESRRGSVIFDKRKSTASSFADRRRSNGALSVYSQAIAGDSSAQQGGEVEYVNPKDPRRSVASNLALSDKRKSWKPARASGLVDGSAVEEGGKKKGKRPSKDVTAEYSSALAGGNNDSKAPPKPDDDAAGSSALAFVVGSN
ncbi:hypothetical protein HDU99_010973 [Rhizoclosmatium hyalinum]|nr:hypothetical protein HDU99_010973 [Rhizoclosmatium hyalinum]